MVPNLSPSRITVIVFKHINSGDALDIKYFCISPHFKFLGFFSDSFDHLDALSGICLIFEGIKNISLLFFIFLNTQSHLFFNPYVVYVVAFGLCVLFQCFFHIVGNRNRLGFADSFDCGIFLPFHHCQKCSL